MNFYDKHIGDYLKKTIGLTMMEDGAYNRLMDYCYQSEHPLPLDRKEVYKLARAAKAAEKKAVDVVLDKFFKKTEQGFVQNRIQEELEKYWDRDADSDTKKENDRIRQQRARERRKALFDALRSLGEVPAYNTPTGELQALLSRVTSRDIPQPVTQQVTRDNTAIQSPLPTTQLTQETSSLASTVVGACDDQDERPTPKRNVEIAILLRAKGVKPLTFAHPQAIEWADNPAVTDEVLLAAVQSARDYKPTGDISPNYLKPIVEQLLNPPEQKPQKQPQDNWWMSNPGIERKGKELGMFARGTESYNDFKDRIFEELRKRGGKAA